ncbi:MAG: hypothetical protein M3Y06_06155, partial [Actinomycetota bacterium]|nr:hypothetical protein [Actinomycetota bacterium]
MSARRSDLPRVLTVREAERLGVSRSAVRHGLASHGWQRLARGVVFTAVGAATRDDWVQVGMELSGPHAALSGWDAARLRGIGDRTPPNPRVLVLDHDGTHRRVGLVQIRPTARAYTTSLLPGEHPTLPYVPVVHPARAIADTGLAYHDFTPVRALVTSSIQRRVCRPDELVAELVEGPRAGSRWLRRALRDVLDGARSIAEADAVDRLRAGRVPSFELNVPIVDCAGRVVAVADVLWRALRAIAEIDSREFHFTEHDWKRTLRRHNLLTRHGFAVAHHPPS